MSARLPLATTARRALPALLVALALAPAATLAAGFGSYVPGEVLVRFKAGTADVRRAGALAARAHLAVADLDDGWLHVRLRPGETVEEAMAAYAGDPAVAWVQPNFLYRASLAPTDPSYGQQWALANGGQPVGAALLQAGDALYGSDPAKVSYSNPGIPDDDIRAERAWNLATDCSGAVVAVIDTGVKYDHQDLAANMWTDPAFPKHGVDLVTDDGDPMDENGHGTHVAGIIAARANNGVGTAGVCWTARIMAIRVLDATGTGDTRAIRAGIDFARTHGASVVNMSLGGAGANDALLAEAIDAAVNAGVVMVVAAGNEGANNDTAPTYPCNDPSPGLLCVAALDQRYQLATFSNYGANSVHVGAPGTNIVATWAGTQSAVKDPLTGAAWTTTSSSGTGFGFISVSLGGKSYPALADPPGDTTYAPATDDRAWRTFDGSGADVVTAEFLGAVDVSAGDWVRVACRSTAGDPFAAPVLLDEMQATFTHQTLVPVAYDLSRCLSPTLSFGFQLQSAAPGSAADLGVTALMLTLKKLALNTTSYNTISGTSMATPVVAGVAALVRSYQPRYTPADVVGAITGGGRYAASLQNKTRSGHAVDAHGALRYVNPPRGLTSAVQ